MSVSALGFCYEWRWSDLSACHTNTKDFQYVLGQSYLEQNMSEVEKKTKKQQLLKHLRLIVQKMLKNSCSSPGR